MGSKAPSLLDLPDLALERIFFDLSPSDLASCLMCCTTLRTFLRPRQSAMVRTRSLGRRWGLRSCGYALVSKIADLFGVSIPKESDPPESDESPLERSRTALRRIVVHSAPVVCQAFAVLKTLPEPLAGEGIDGYAASQHGLLTMDVFVYSCALAESMNFPAVLGMMEVVWERVMDSARVLGGGREAMLRASFSGGRSKCILRDGKLIPPPRFFLGLPEPNPVDVFLYRRIFAEAMALLPAELVCALWMAGFLSRCEEMVCPEDVGEQFLWLNDLLACSC